MTKNPNWDKHRKKYGKDKSIAKYLTNGQVTEDDIDLIDRFIANKIAMGKRSLGEEKATSITLSLIYFRKYIKVPYRKVTMDDIESGLGAFKSGKSLKGTPYSQNTQHDWISSLKAFLIFLSKKGYISISREVIREEISAPSVNSETTEAKELFTPEEMLKMISTTKNLMHKAFISVSYESGGRPEEVASMVWEDMIPDKYGIKGYLQDFKTKSGKKRFTRLTMSAPYVAEWKQMSPMTKQQDWIFIGRGNKPISWHSAETILYRAGKRACLGKKTKLYLCRKSRITEMYKSNTNATAIRETIWGNQSTRMTQTYVRLSERDTDKMLLEGAGYKIDDNNVDNVLRPITCHYCHTPNGADAEYCKRCGTPIGKTALSEYESADKQIEESEIYKSIYAKLKADMGIK